MREQLGHQIIRSVIKIKTEQQSLHLMCQQVQLQQ